MFVILDNMVDGLTEWVETFQDRRGCVNFCASFVLISLGVGAAILHTTQVSFTKIMECYSTISLFSLEIYSTIGF